MIWLLAASAMPLDDVAVAQRWLAALQGPVAIRAKHPFESDERMSWRYTPSPRPGVHHGELGAAASQALEALLRQGLGEEGFRLVHEIRMLEDRLREIERNPGRDRDRYFLAVFGEPGSKGGWAWRYEGHHISLNFTFEGETLVSSTPQFLGANPATLGEGATAHRPLGDLEDLAFTLLAGLSEAQRARAILSARAPGDILTSNSRTAQIEGRKGLPYADMRPEQQALIRRLVAAHCRVQRPAERGRRLKRIEAEGWAGVVFAWMGADRPGVGHYYRVQGKTFLIELDNSLSRANHVHTVWRDFEGDWGRDVLREHRESAHKSIAPGQETD